MEFFKKKLSEQLKKGFTVYGIDERENAESKNLLDKFYNFEIQDSKKIFLNLKKLIFQ